MNLAQKIAIGYIRARLNMLAVVSPARAAKQALIIFNTPQYKSGKRPPIFLNPQNGRYLNFMEKKSADTGGISRSQKNC